MSISVCDIDVDNIYMYVGDASFTHERCVKY